MRVNIRAAGLPLTVVGLIVGGRPHSFQDELNVVMCLRRRADAEFARCLKAEGVAGLLDLQTEVPMDRMWRRS